MEALIMTGLIWGAAYILGHEIRLGLREIKLTNNIFNVKDGHFYYSKEQMEKMLFGEESEGEDGK